MKIVYEVNGLSCDIDGRKILRDVSFTVGEGEYLSVIGPNGAGKTTLIKCMGRIMRGGTGTIKILGRPLAEYSSRELAKRVSYVPQADGRLFPFTVSEFVLMGRYPYLSPFTAVGPGDRKAAEKALETVGMGEFSHRPLNTLSGGERQKVFIAAALVQEAGIMLLDEPTTFLDPRHSGDIMGILYRLNRGSGATIVSVTHDINNAALYGHRVIALREGSVAYDGSPGGIMDSEVLSRVFGKEFLFTEHPQTGKRIVVPEAI
ncbi:MAG: ABC transporter ATP-binding protein [bacterium]|nr:MAG: ABC transporter ATP-binding protein [bacterium]